MIYKKIASIVLILLFMSSVFVLDCSSSLSNLGEIQILRKDKLPKELNLKINETCTEHKFFLQAAVQDDGSFAIYTRGKSENNRWYDLDLVFVDIFDEEGKFIKEIEFETTLDVAIELNNSIVNIYLYSSIIRYNIKTNELEYLIVPDDIATKNGIIKKLRAKELSAGEWEFFYQECREGYTQLIRTKNGATEVVVSLEGTDNNFFNPTIIVSSLLVCFWLIYKWKNKRGRT